MGRLSRIKVVRARNWNGLDDCNNADRQGRGLCHRGAGAQLGKAAIILWCLMGPNHFLLVHVHDVHVHTGT